MHASSPSTDTAARLIGKLVAERYRIEELLATGGMGAVYRAVDSAGRAYAIKFLHPHVATETLSRRFLRESKVAESIDHPHIVPVVDAGQHQDVPFLVMPLLAGRDAGMLLADVGPLAPTVAVRIVVQACSGVAALHDSGIIHRDIKPTNLFLATQPGGKVVVKVFDFGIAKEIGALDHTQLTQTGTELGSPHYMSPEQARDAKQVDERSDVWSLAVTLYKLLSGKVVFDESSGLGHYLLSVATRDPRPLQDNAPWIDPMLARAIHGALVRDPDRRCATARELAAQLSPFTGGSVELEVGELAGVTAAERARTAARADLRDLYPSSELREAETSADAAVGERLKRNETLDRLVNKKLGGRWQVIRLLGRGGMGAVFEVRDDQGVRAAAKVIGRQHFVEGEQTVRRFVREANASRAIDSPHVVRTLEVEQDDELAAPFIVMELMEGVDLGSLLRSKAPIEPAPLVAAFVQAARGLAAAHAQGIIHRDIKPGNLFLDVEPSSGKVMVKVCDFGIAKRANAEGQFDQTSHELTQTGGMLGSPMYMSPEQAVNAKHVDHRTDIWSLAISLYEGLSGRKVWAGRTALGEILVAICTQQVPPLRSVAPWVDPGLAEVVHRGLEQQPLSRWASVEEMIAALQPYAQPGELRLDDLVPVAEELRAQLDLLPDSPDRVAATSAGVERAPFNGKLAAGTSTGDTHAPRRGWRLVASATFAAALAAAAFSVAGPKGALSQRLHLPWASSDPTGEQGAAAAAPEAPRVLRYLARVSVTPANAEVQVDGQRTNVVDGAIQLDGEPGQSFEVLVESEGTTQRTRVMLSNEGKAMPDHVALQTPVVAAPTSSSVPVRTAVGRKPRDASKGKPADTAAVEAPVAPTAAPATDPAKPSFKNAW